MGLTSHSVGRFANHRDLKFDNNENSITIALAGNPNVGKSTLFNSLTGMNQHTGNWSGKTVSTAVGKCTFGGKNRLLIDIPGTYSLSAHSAEELVARDFLCFSDYDAVIIVCDASVLERNLFLVLQILEITSNAILCVNLLDEAERKGITVDLPLIEQRLGIPVIGTVAKKKKTLAKLITAVDSMCQKDTLTTSKAPLRYSQKIENALLILKPATEPLFGAKSRAFGIKLLTEGAEFLKKSADSIKNDKKLNNALKTAQNYLLANKIGKEDLEKEIASCIYKKSEQIVENAINKLNSGYSQTDRRLDRLFTGKYTAYPFMMLLLALIFWITVTGANYPSEWLSNLFSSLENKFGNLLLGINTPKWLYGILVSGVFKVVSWIISVMLPPMAIFFPLFTLLEDSGFLPRIAYNLDRPFKLCGSCGKQALTMSMGFGCNCAGIVGARIIDSPRERMLAIITNSLVPCNGRFPAIITLITLFFVGSVGAFGKLMSALYLTAVILLGILGTFLTTLLLSKTVFKGTPSSFALEMPPYRRPEIAKTLIRSVFDRTLSVLGRAITVAAPAGALIWIISNTFINGTSLLILISDFLDPFGKILGLDGIIIMAFILGLPANEIVLPIALMAYCNNQNLTEMNDLIMIKHILQSNGWTAVTAINTVIFSLFHWPCATALLTVKKETGSKKMMLLAAVLPTLLGVVLCLAVNFLSKIF